MKPLRALLPLLLACLAPPAARAELHRIGLFIGVDKGLDHEPSLRFASRDAREMAKIFQQTGIYPEGGLTCLANPTLPRLREEMARIESAVSAWRSKGDQASLFVYFSGHGDAQSLHIRGAKLGREELIAWLNGLKCELKIVILDACESGDFLRAKGGRYLEDMPIQIENDLKSRGVIIVSSTSRGELAQESDEYQGAIFTHHLKNGLRGLANYNGDAWVGLQEAFEYSRRATATDMAITGGLRQNPSFDLDLVGGADPALVPVERSRSRMLLRNFPSGTLEVHDANSLHRVAKVWLSGGDSLTYGIPTGSYLFLFREEGREVYHTASIGSQGMRPIDRKAFQEKARWKWSKKGGRTVRLNGAQAGFGAPSPFPGLDLRMGRVDFVTRTATAKRTLSLGMGLGEGADSANRLSVRARMYRLGLSHHHHLGGFQRLRVSAGALAAFAMLRQEVTDSRFGGGPVAAQGGMVPARTIHWARVYQAGLPIDLEWAVWDRFWISGEGRWSLYAYKDAASGGHAFRQGFEPFLSAGFHF